VSLKRCRPRASLSIASLLAALALALTLLPSSARAFEKQRRGSMNDYFRQQTPLTYTAGRSTPAVIETTLRHQVFFSDMDGSTADWNVIDFRAGQPNAWHLVTGGAHACVGTSWWMGQSGFLAGDGYDNNWVQSLVTNVPINLAGTTGNKLTFKSKFQSEDSYDYGWVLIKGSSLGARWDTLGFYTGDLGTSCVNRTLDIADSFTTVTQPILLQFLFGSDLNVSASDSLGAFSGWSIDDVQVKSQGNPPGGPVRFFDDMESGSAKWVASSPDPGPLWHLETAPSTSSPATCFFLTTQLWVPFVGSGFGIVPDHADAMLTSPTMDLTGVFSPATPTTSLLLQIDDWENIPDENFLSWTLFIRGSNDKTTWTPWRDAVGIAFSSLSPQCKEGNSISFNPYFTATTGIQPGTKYIQLGFRLRDLKATTYDDLALECGPKMLGVNTEGIYLDDIGVYYVYTLSGVETVGGAPVGTRAAIRRVYPNPFNPSTTVEFSTPKQGPVAVRVYDLQGRQVATLTDTSLPAGVYRVKWDGRDRAGREVSSGVYFANIESAGGRQAARLILLK
jgi:hypothetical protein